MIAFKWAHGDGGWLTGPEATARRQMLNMLVRDHALEPEQLHEDWDDDWQVLEEIVALRDGLPVATAMLIIDPERAYCPARIFGQAALDDVATACLIDTMEDLLVAHGMPDPVFEFVEGTAGRMIPIPHFDMSSYPAPYAQHLN